jgi:Ca2+-transporting ATPase
VLAVAAAASRLETGDPLDRAILDAAGRGADGEVLAVFPFTEDRRSETAVIRGAAGITAYTKGAPEAVLAMCSDDDRAGWLARVAELATGGHKVIGCASRALADYAGGEPDRALGFVGLVAIADPVRPGVAEAVAWCRAAGVRVLVLTGDHPATARAVAREIGLAQAPVIVTGEALAAADDVGAAVADADVVARALPAQKLSIVRALQRAGEIVAVTGDGVNDVPALQAADVGIAMGQSGARSAREVSSIVLLDDDFRSVVAAVAEGRALFDHLRRAFQYLLMIHIPLVLTATFIPLLGYPVLYLPIHIVWLEAVIHPTALLVFQGSPVPGGEIPPGRGKDVRLFARAEWAIIAVVGALITVVVAVTYDRSLVGGDDAHARAMAMVAMSAASVSVMTALSGLRTPTARAVAALTIGFAVVLVQTRTLASLLHLRPLHLDDWLLALAGGLLAVLPVLAVRIARGPRGAAGDRHFAAPGAVRAP